MKTKLLILCGIPFSGKSTLATELEKYGFKRIDLDIVKTDLLGKDAIDSSINQSTWDKIYNEMYSQINSSLKSGVSVVHDTGNFTIYERSLISKIATKLGIPYYTIYVATPADTARLRMTTNRETNSRFNVTDESFASAVNEMETPNQNENPLTYNESDDVGDWVTKNELNT